VVDIFSAYQGDVVVCTEADGARYLWTARVEAIFGGGVIFECAETEDHNTYRRGVITPMSGVMQCYP